MRQGGKKLVKPGEYLTWRASWEGFKMLNLLERRKYSNKRKSQGKKTEYILKLKIWGNWEEKKEEKTLKAKKEKKDIFLIKCLKQWLHNRFVFQIRGFSY